MLASLDRERKIIPFWDLLFDAARTVGCAESDVALNSAAQTGINFY